MTWQPPIPVNSQCKHPVSFFFLFSSFFIGRNVYSSQATPRLPPLAADQREPPTMGLAMPNSLRKSRAPPFLKKKFIFFKDGTYNRVGQHLDCCPWPPIYENRPRWGSRCPPTHFVSLPWPFLFKKKSSFFFLERNIYLNQATARLPCICICIYAVLE